MNTESDLVFAGQREVIVVAGRRDFVPHGGAMPTWLAGRYVDRVAPASLQPGDVAGLFGQFVMLRHDVAGRRLVLATDRFGLYPLYLARDRGQPQARLLLSTDADALRRACCAPEEEIDLDALSDILAFNVPFDHRTLAPGVGSVGGGVRLTIDLDTLAVEEQREWQPELLLARGDLSFDQVKDQLVDLFLEGVDKVTAGEPLVAVTLSGGADSRCLLAGSLHGGHPTVVYSTGVPGSRALAYAHGMATRCGVPDHAHPLDAGFLASFTALMDEACHSMQGMSFSSELEAMWLQRHVEPRGVLLHGAFAELFKIGKMHNYHYDTSIARLRGDALADELWRRFAARYGLRRGGFAPELAEALGERAREHLSAKVTRHGSTLGTADVLQMLYIEEFLGKVARASWNMWRQRLPVHFPFAYPPLVDMMLRVRAPDKIANHFVLHLLRRTNPTLARYPDSNTGAPLGASKTHRRLVHLADYAVNRLIRSKARADHQDFASWLSVVQPPMETVFARLQREAGGFDLAHVNALLARCRSGEDLAARTVHFLWAWGLWREQRRRAAAQGDVRMNQTFPS